MTETWLPVEGFDGYEISDLGRVRCWRRRYRFQEPPTEPRIVKLRMGTNGYLNVLLGFKSKTGQIHRLVAEAFVPGRLPGLEVAHQNGDRTDNRAVNLSWKTRKENMADMRGHGTSGRKINIGIARQVREVYDRGDLTQTEVGKMFDLTQGTVGKIVRGELWAEVA